VCGIIHDIILIIVIWISLGIRDHYAIPLLLILIVDLLALAHQLITSSSPASKLIIFISSLGLTASLIFTTIFLFFAVSFFTVPTGPNGCYDACGLTYLVGIFFVLAAAPGAITGLFRVATLAGLITEHSYLSGYQRGVQYTPVVMEAPRQ